MTNWTVTHNVIVVYRKYLFVYVYTISCRDIPECLSVNTEVKWNTKTNEMVIMGCVVVSLFTQLDR